MRYLLLFLVLWGKVQAAALPNLEDNAQDFVLDSWQIKIPGYPLSFNPCIIEWRGGLLMSFRIRDPQTASTNKIGFVWLDGNFNLLGEPYVLDLPPVFSNLPAKAQDPRLIAIGDTLYMVYNNLLAMRSKIEIRRMFVARLDFDGREFSIKDEEALLYFELEQALRPEKNWVPFEYEGKLLLAYSLKPHLILQPLRGMSSCATLDLTETKTDWKWGVLRGGTPALLHEDKYLAFFHSSIDMKTVHSSGKPSIHYFMGAYTFEAQPPFAITHMSSEPIIGKGFYTGPLYKTWKPLRALFPGGFITRKGIIWLFYGKQDHEIWVAKLHKKDLLDSLEPLDTKQ